MLKLVGSTKQTESFVSNVSTKPFQKYLESDRFKYQRALAVQKLKDDPDAVLINIRYHFAWNVIHRRSLFSDPEKAFKIIDGALFECGLSVSSFVSLLWLAPDHLHIYVESDGEKSVGTIAQEIKRLSESFIISKGSEKIPNMSTSNDLWDKAYFAETIG